VDSRPRISVAGAGLVGARHIEEIDASPSVELASIVEPGPAGPSLAEKFAVARFDSVTEMLEADRPDGVILATPNRMHVHGGLACVAARVPVIVEKPVGDTVQGATRLVEAGEAAGVAVLTGHHRNYSPILAKAREIVRSGRLGSLVAITGSALFYKPDDYFDVGDGWRREPGGGPILLNLIHDVNCLMALGGDIVEVQAMASSAARGFPVEDTATMSFRFSGGALGTFVLSDTAASPRSWEQTSRENKSYASYPDEDCYHIAGTAGSLSVPTMRVRVFPGERSWSQPFDGAVEDTDRSDPLANQVAHFAAVIRGAADPICTGRDGLNALRVVEAVVRSAGSGTVVPTGLGPAPSSEE
jgi:predicted dehydrogenase